MFRGGLAEGSLQIIRRVEFLCHDINVHVPHHVNSKIPWYNLRAATDSLRSNWGEVRRARSLLCSSPNTWRSLHWQVVHAVINSVPAC